MENFFHKETDGIYRLPVPFDNIYTSVFLIIANEKRILVDCATTSDDVDGYIVPALTELGYTLSDVDIIVISHKHGDHAGGIERVMALAPEIEVVKGVEVVLADGISTYSLAGHTVDCIGVLDERTATLITADGLQGAGVDKYRCSIKYRTAYIETLEKIKTDERVKNLLFSHAYEPWNKDRICGRGEVLVCLSDCIKYFGGNK